MNETVTFIEVSCDAETDKALHCLGEDLGEKGAWVPKSQVHDDSEIFKKGHTGTLVVTYWWAEEAKLI